MFKKAQNIETAFQHIRIFCGLVIVGAFAFCGYVVYQSDKKVSQAQGKIYILASGKAMEAFTSDRKENIPVEARDHITHFHALFFALDPDDKAIAAGISKALYLADGSVKRLYDNLKENGYYSNIISGNISQQVVVDSISLDTHSYPFYFRCFATQKIIRATSIATRNLITEGYLRDVARSENNPHGFLLERFSIVENKDLKIETR